jgi:hypothetical protein
MATTGRVFEKIFLAAIIIYLCLVGLAFLDRLWHATVGDLIIWCSPVIVIWIIFRACIYKEYIKRRFFEPRVEGLELVRIEYDVSKLFHRYWCTDVIDRNLVFIRDSRDAVAQGYTPCKKCHPS